MSIPLTMWDVKGNCAKGRSKEALQINRNLDNIKEFSAYLCNERGLAHSTIWLTCMHLKNRISCANSIRNSTGNPQTKTIKL